MPATKFRHGGLMGRQLKGWTEKIPIEGTKKFKFYARMCWTDAQGKKHYIHRRAKNKTDAGDIIRTESQKIATDNPTLTAGHSMSMADLITYYKKNYCTPPVYRKGVKVSGLRSWKDMEGKLDALSASLGGMLLRDVTRETVNKYKKTRVNTPTLHKKPKERSLTTVNRELEVLRRVLNIAEGAGWIQKNPFTKKGGEALIVKAHEVPRDRFASHEEEEKILAVCVGARAHLRPIVITAIDTGQRSGELHKIKREDVDFARGVIHIQILNTKTLRYRAVPMTSRVRAELTALLAKLPEDFDEPIFGQKSHKRSWSTACRQAGV